MLSVAEALSKGYGVPLEDINSNVYDLIRRFGNRSLMDTNARVGADPKRKLKNIDRLTGAALYCIEQGMSADGIIPAIAAGLMFDNPDDASAMEVQQFIREHGVENAVEKYCEVSGELKDKIAAQYYIMKKQADTEI